MEATVIRQRVLSSLIVGATGVHVFRVVSAFEQKRIVAVRAETIEEACERIALDMPLVVLVLLPTTSRPERDALDECSFAVGARAVYLDATLGAGAFNDVLERAVNAALERKVLRDQAEIEGKNGISELADIEVDLGDTLILEDADGELDDGWGE